MRERQEPIFDVAQLAHIEFLTPTPERTIWFFKDLLGMQETARAQQSVYLRGYEESYHHSLKITEAAAPGLGHVAWRSSSPQAFERRAAAIVKSAHGSGWVERELANEIVWDVGQPVTWREEDLERGIVFHGGSLPAEFFTYGTPDLEQTEPAEVT